MNTRITVSRAVASVRALVAMIAFWMSIAGIANAQNSLVWTGSTSATWDAATANWNTVPGGAPAAFTNGDTVLIDDTSTTPTITISNLVAPASVLVDADRNITLTPTAGNGLSGAVPLTKRGTGTLTFTATNAGFTGTTTIEAGMLKLQSGPNNGSLATGPVVLAGGTLSTAYTGSRLIVSETIIVPSGEAGAFYLPKLFRYSGAIQGSGTLTIDATALVDGKNDFSPDFTGFHGEARITNNISLPLGINETVTTGMSLFPLAGLADTSLVLNSGTITFLMSNGSGTMMPIGALSGAGDIAPVYRKDMVNRSTGKLTYQIGAKNLDTTFAGSISGTTVSLEKNGTGILTFAGVNTYTGTTTVTSGGLRVTGQIANTSTIGVSASGALGGSGTIISTGGITFANGATLLVDANASGTLVGPAITGAVVANGTLNVTPIVPSGVTLASGTYTILQPTGGITGSPTLAWVYSGSGVTAAFDTTTPGAIKLTLTAALAAAPVITSPLTASGTVGTAFTYTITGSNNPTSFGATGLPGGLAVGAGTGIITGVPSDSGLFNVTISATNATGFDSETLVMTMNAAPTITTQPASTQTVFVGQPASFAVSATGYPIPSYQWNKNGSAIASATSSTYSIASTSLADSGTYNVTIGNSEGSVTSADSVCTVNALLAVPSVTTQPTATQTVLIGQSVSFTAAASGNPAPEYSWSKNGVAIASATNATYSIPTATLADSGTYVFTATNSQGSASSNNAVLIVNPLAPVITSLLTATGTQNSAFAYTITATNSPASYNATGLPAGLGVNTASGLIDGTPTVNGAFNVSISAMNVTGTDTATLALAINAAPTITTQPASAQTVNAGQSASFSVAASGYPAPTYSWSKNGSPIPSATNATYTIAATALADSGTYTATVTNSAGSATTNDALLTVNPLAPVITSALVASGTVGTSFTYTITGSNSPSGFDATNLPSGLNVNTATGVIDGIPTITGTNDVVISATNAGGIDSKTLVLTIHDTAPATPVITSELNATATIGTSFSYQIEATNSPFLGFDAAPLPAGMSVDHVNGTITGAPTTTGVTNVVISATNSAGSDSATLRIAVIQPVSADTLLWTGSNGNVWDKTTENWTMAGLATNYEDGDKAFFSDSSTTTTVSITEVLTPGSVTVDVSGSLTLVPTSGKGMSGAIPVLKRGKGMLTVGSGTFSIAAGNSNTAVTGTTTVEEGIFRNGYVMSNAVDSTVGTIVLAGGTYSTGYTTASSRSIPNTTIIVPSGKTGVVVMPGQYRYNNTFKGSGTLVLNFPVSAGANVAEFGADFENFQGEVQFTGPNVGNVRLPITDRGTSTPLTNYFSGTTAWANTSVVFNTGTITPLVANASVLVVPIGALSGNGTFVPGARNNLAASSGKLTYQIGAKNLDTTFAGAFTGSNTSIEKTGTGTLTFAGVNTYTGTTTVTSGALHVTGQLANTSTVSVSASGALGGSGTITTTGVTFASGATLLLETTASGTLVGPAITGAVAANGTLKVSPIVPSGVTIASGTYTILQPTGGITGSPTLAWAYSGTGITATFDTATPGIIKLAINAGLSAAPVITSPLTATGTVGTAFTYTITGSNTPTSFGATGLPGGLAVNASNGNITGVPSVSGLFNVTISATNAAGFDSGTMALTVNAAPSITTQPVAAQTVFIGQPSNFVVSATGYPLPSYQWNKDGSAIASATTSTYSIASTSLADSGTYTVTLTNSQGSLTSADSVLTVSSALVAPTFTTQPAAAQTIVVGQSANLTAAASGNPAPTYLWSKNGVVIPSATNATFAIASAALTDSGTYTVAASNSQGSAVSNNAIVTVNPPAPVITSALTTSGTLSTAFNYTIVATNSPTGFGAANLPAGLVVSSTTGVISGVPTVSGSFNSSISALNVTGTDTKALSITINAAPAITTQPAATQTVNAGQSVNFNVAATGYPAPSYAWSRNGTTIASATTATYSIASATVADSGTFKVTVTNAAGSVTSNNSVLTVNPLAPVITSALTASGTVGSAFSYTITGSNGPTSFSASTLPDGLSVSASTGVISGTPTVVATSNVSITASNSAGFDTKTLVLTITDAPPAVPAITSDLVATATLGLPFSYQILASNGPITGYGAQPLPTGLTLNSTGVISGAATATGLTNVILSATNALGSGTATLKLRVVEPVAADALLWTGSTSNVWNNTSVNWTMAGLATNYDNGDKVIFNDTALPLGISGTISIAEIVTPASVTVDISSAELVMSPAAGKGISGAVPLTKKGAGTLTFTATNAAFTGTTTVEAGVLKLQSAPSNGSLGTGPVVLTGGTLSTAYSGNRLLVTETIVVPEGKAGAFYVPKTFRYSGRLQGSGTLTLDVTALTAANNDFSPDFTDFHGEARIKTNMSLPLGINENFTTGMSMFPTAGMADTSLVLSSGTLTFLMTNSSTATVQIGALSGAGDFAPVFRKDLSARSTGKLTYQIGAKNLDSTFAGTFSGTTVSINKVGTGTLTLGGVSTFVGPTTVSAGGLRVTGKLTGSGTVTVANNAAIGGSGEIAGDVVLGTSTTLLIDSDATGALSGLKIAGRMSAPATLTVTPVVPAGVRLVNGTYTILDVHGGLQTTSTFAWSYPADPAITAVFSVIDTNKYQVTIGGGAIARPVISSAPKADGLVGQFFQYLVVATSDPASPTQLAVTGLDGTGLSFTPGTNAISGTPIAAGRYPVTISATNSSGTNTANIEIIIYASTPPVPLITSATTATAVVGQPFTYTITASNDPTSFAAPSLPAGLTINANTGVISGTPEANGHSTVSLSARNIAGNGTAQLDLTISLPAPVISSPTHVTTIQGTPFSYQITASNNPTSFGATGFPGGFVINTTTGLVTGTFMTTGSSSATISAANIAGSGTATLGIIVQIPPPEVQGSDTASGTVGADFTYQIVATNSPTSYAALNLPPGLIVNTATGLISGKPEGSGTYSVSLVAMNGTGPGTKNITLVIGGESALATLAGSAGTSGSADGSSADARFNSPNGAAVDKSGNLYIADTDNNSIRKIAADGTVSTFATGLNAPTAIVIDAAGTTLYVANANAGTISKIDIATRAVTTLAVTGTPPLSAPHGLAIDSSGNLYVADAGNDTIRKIVTTTGAMTTIAGTAGTPGSANGTGTAATFNTPMGLAINSDGTHLYVADTNNNAVRSITLSTGVVETVAATGVTLNTPQALAVDANGILYVADTGNNAICTIDTATNVATTITSPSALNAPGGVVIDSTGDIYVIDTGSHTIRVLQIGPSIITSPTSQTVAAGSSATLKVAASGAPTPSYQWYKDGVIIAGATKATLTINPVQRTDAGNYYALVTNSMGTAQSNSASLTVDGSPSQPSNDGFGSNGGGGGGAPSWMYFAALALLAAITAVQRRFSRDSGRSHAARLGAFVALFAGLSFVGATTELRAQPTHLTGVIAGKVSSEKTGLSLVAAEVSITVDGKAVRVLTENDGTYRFGNLAAGTYAVRVAYADLDPQSKTATIETGATATLDFSMASEVHVLEKFTVSAEREGQSAAIQRQRQSDVMKNVVAADAFGNLIDTNPGELLKNLPGVFVNYSGEDVASYSIRGISSDEGTISIDGNTFANSGGDNTRGVSLKMVNVAGLESVEVYKAPPPSSPANANGGVINMITKNAFDQKGRRLDLQASMGFNTSALNYAPVPTGNRTPDRVWSPGFNIYYSEAFLKNRLGISLSANAYQTYRFNDDYRISSYQYDKPSTAMPSADMTGYSKSILLEEASGRTQKRGMSLSVDYKVARNTAVYVKTSYNDSKSLADSVASMAFNTGNGTVYTASSNFNRVEADDMELTMNVAGPQKYKNQAWSVNPGVKHTFGAIRLDYDGYVSRSFIQRTPNDESVTYTSPSGHFILDNIQSKQGPTIQQLGITSSNDYLNLNNYSGLSIDSRDRLYVDEMSGGKANIRMPVSLFGQQILVQSGVSYNAWSRNRREYRYQYSLNDTSASSPKYGEFYDPVRKDSWEFKSTPVANWLSTWKVGDYYRENPSLFTLNETRLDDTLHSSSIAMDENIAAAYAMASTQISKFNVMVGVRYEYTDAVSSGFATDKRLPRTDPLYRQWVEGKNTYGDFFPNVQLRYEPLANLVFRAAYTTSIGRPKLEYLIPADSISSSSATNIVTVTRKNPDLLPQYSHNFDLGVEYYLPKSGVLSANVFRKQISDYILESERSLADYPELLANEYYRGLYDQYPGYDILVTTALNAGKATMDGFEIAYRQSLTFLPSFLKNIELNGSFSYANPSGDIDISELKKKVANMQIKYRSNGWLFQVSYYWCGRYLVNSPSTMTNPDGSLAIGTDGVYEKPSSRFDMSINYQFSRNWTASLDWRNVLNEPIRQREIFGRISRYSEAGTIVNLVLKYKL